MTFLPRYASVSFFGAIIAIGFNPETSIAGEYAAARFTGSHGNRCAAYGRDFVGVEGSDACVRMGGRIRVQLSPNTGLFGKPGWPGAGASSATLRSDNPPKTAPSHLRVNGSIGYPNPFH